jgi:hypothetical protein
MSAKHEHWALSALGAEKEQQSGPDYEGER